ncbi:hypothetical protein KY284_036601 [Solanum tuberosum]|nr:hypothetical protein KY284_036601 [Solanum tuberosum]
MKDYELIDIFLQAQEPDYFHYLLAAMGKPFAEAIKIGEILENDIISEGGRVHDDVWIESIITHPICNSQHSSICSTSSGTNNGGAPAPYGSCPQQQHFQAPNNPRPRTDYTREQDRKENFTPIGESYTSLLRKLVQLRLVEPINPYFVNSNARGFDPTVICGYHANTPGHSTENCWTLKRVIEKLIEDKVIDIRNEEAPNVTNNPLPVHNKEHVVGMVDIYENCEQTCRIKMKSRDSKEESSMVLEPIQKAPIIVNGASSNFGDSRKLVLYVPGALKRREVPLNGPKLYIHESVKEPVVIQIATQLPMTNTKTVPWNYNKVVVTHKGNEIVEETNETRGLTRSGRCYAPEELRRDKQAKENQLPVKKPVSEEEAEEFL